MQGHLELRMLPLWMRLSWGMNPGRHRSWPGCRLSWVAHTPAQCLACRHRYPVYGSVNGRAAHGGTLQSHNGSGLGHIREDWVTSVGMGRLR